MLSEESRRHFPSTPLKYLLRIAVAEPEGVELREEVWLDSRDLRVELHRPGHGRGSRKQDHSPGRLGKQSGTSLIRQLTREAAPAKKSSPAPKAIVQAP